MLNSEHVYLRDFAINLQIIFEGITGSSYQSDIAIDDIYFGKGTCCQLRHRTFDAGRVGELNFFHEVYRKGKKKNL